MLVDQNSFGSTLEYVERMGREEGLIVDLETTGLSTYSGDYLIGVAVGGRRSPGEWYFSARHAEDNIDESQLRALLRVLTLARSLGGHNFIRFDLPMLRKDTCWTGSDPLLWREPGRLWDSIVAATLTNENESSYSLDALGQKYLGENANKAATKRDMMDKLRMLVPRLRSDKSLMGHLKLLPGRDVAAYACADISDCRKIQDLCEENLALWPDMLRIAEEHYQYVRLLARIQRSGLRVNEEAIHAKSTAIKDTQNAIMATLSEQYGTVNFNSPSQVAVLCGTENAQASTLEVCGHPAAREITRYKRLGKVLGYYTAMLERMDSHGIIHPQLNLTKDPRDLGGTRGTRLSCSNPNFQNLPKRAATEPMLAVREVIVPKAHGDLIYPADYERAEMWLGAHYSKDGSLADAYYAGRDLYQELADKVNAACIELGIDLAFTRHDGKTGYLAIQYGAGARKIAEMFGWDYLPRDSFPGADYDAPWAERNKGWEMYFEQPSPAFKRAFFEMFPGVKEQMRSMQQEAEDQRCIQLWSGKWLHFDNYRSRTFTAWNRKIQGGVGEMVRIAMQRLEEPLDALGAHMTLQVHDEIVVEGPKELKEQIKKTQTETMTAFDFWLPPRVEVSAGNDYHNVGRI